MIRNTFLASAILLGAVGAATAATGPRLIGSDMDAQVVYDTAPGSQVGGAAVRMQGTGDNASFAYAAPMPRNGQRATLEGTGDNASLRYGASTRQLSRVGG